jgi:hypothetical protein
MISFSMAVPASLSLTEFRLQQVMGDNFGGVTHQVVVLEQRFEVAAAHADGADRPIIRIEDRRRDTA